MAVEPIDSKGQQLWGSTKPKFNFFGRVQLTMSRNDAANSYTVSVTGIAAKCGEWNFRTHYSISLGSETASGTIPASGSDTYSGWMPKSGWHTQNLPITVTLTGNPDGSCPAIYLYFKCYNTSVYWKRGKQDISVSSVYDSTNIASFVQSKTGGPNDRSAPSISVSRTGVTSSTLTFSASSGNVDCKDWTYSLDGATAATCKWSQGKGGSLTLNVSEAEHTVTVYANKVSNGVQGSGSQSFDTRAPRISNLTMTASTSTSAVARFSTDFDCTYSITNSSGASLSTGSCTAGVMKSVNITTPASDATYSVNVWRTYNTALNASKDVKCYSAIPSIRTFNMTPINSSTARVTIECNCKFYWIIKRPDGQYYSSAGKNKWSKECAADTAIEADIPVTAVSGSYVLQIQRYVNTALTNSATDSCDTRLPTIKTFELVPVSSDDNSAKANLTLQTDLSCDWTLNTTTVTKPTGTVNTKVNSKLVKIDNKQLKDYTITVNRTSCPALSATGTAYNVDTTPSHLTISNVKTIANTCSFTATADSTCYNWSVALYEVQGGTVTETTLKAFETIQSNNATSVTYTIRNVPMNTKFAIRVKAIKRSNGAHSSAVINTFECLGIVYVNTAIEGETLSLKPCAVYVNVSKTTTPDWRGAVPYVNISSDPEKPSWKFGTIQK